MVARGSYAARRHPQGSSPQDVGGRKGLGNLVDELGPLVDNKLGWFRELRNTALGLKRHPGDLVEQTEGALTKGSRAGIFRRGRLAEEVRERRERFGVIGSGIGYGSGDEVGQLLEDRRVLRRGAVVEARARRIHFKVTVEQERKTGPDLGWKEQVKRGRGRSRYRRQKPVAIQVTPQSDGDLARQVMRVGQRASVEAPSARGRPVAGNGHELASCPHREGGLGVPFRLNHVFLAVQTIDDLESVERAEQ